MIEMGYLKIIILSTLPAIALGFRINKYENNY